LKVYVFRTDLKANGDCRPIQYRSFFFNNRDGECLLRGPNWALKQNIKRFVFKGYYYKTDLFICLYNYALQT